MDYLPNVDYNPDFLENLLDACEGANLTESEMRTLRYLAIEDKHTTDNIASIVRKARQAERHRLEAKQ